MSSERMRYVICYDVPDDKRRTRLAKCLDGYGDRVQYSVFEAVLDRALFDNLVEDARRILDPEEDRLAAYGLCAACARRAVRLGREAEEIPGGEVVFIV